jgi:hypothetical protein
MALTDKEQSQLHYNAWINFRNMLISDFNKVLRHEAETLVETAGRIFHIVESLDKIKERIAFANDHLTFFEERIQFLNKQEEGK